MFNTNNQNILLSVAYLPPISYVKSVIDSKKTTIEQYENYLKQSYRNRCRIYAANGILDLSIPILLATRKKILIKDVKIDYTVPWQKQHLKSIESAYSTSPYFDYLRDDFLPFYTKKYIHLMDLNVSLLHTILDIIEIDKEINLTSDYEHHPVNKIDLRKHFTPKRAVPDLNSLKPYPQVFDVKFRFKPDLSCIDLIFNLGPQAYSYLIGKY
jgi:hypothetical protein